jgi:signal transduction histidine kinase
MGMQQRILAVGGEILIDSHPREGTRIWASIPFAASAQIVQAEHS